MRKDYQNWDEFLMSKEDHNKKQVQVFDNLIDAYKHKVRQLEKKKRKVESEIILIQKFKNVVENSD